MSAVAHGHGRNTAKYEGKGRRARKEGELNMVEPRLPIYLVSFICTCSMIKQRRALYFRNGSIDMKIAVTCI